MNFLFRKSCPQKCQSNPEVAENSHKDFSFSSSSDLPQNKPSSKPTSNDIDESLAKFFFGCNIPFAVVESDHFRNFVKHLNSDYIPPSAKRLSGSLLDAVNEKIINMKLTRVDKKSVLLVDGWKNKSKNEKYVVGIIHNANGEKFFLNSWDFTETSETGDSLTEVTEKAVNEAKEIYGTEIYAVVSDNVSTMMKMGKQVNLFHATCNSHSGNLLGKSLVDSNFSGDLNMVLVEFKSSILERQITLLGGQKIVLAGETRWCSYRDATKCCLRNLSIMQELVRKKEYKISPKVAKLIMEKSFENKLLSSLMIYDGVCELINKCQADHFNIADAVEEWLKLQLPFKDEYLESILEKRLQKVITPIGLSANRLHPIYKGKLFSANENYLQMISHFFSETLDASGMRDLDAYNQEEGIFRSLHEKEITNPQTYWSMVEPHHKKLAELAKSLLNIPSSTAAIERLFSQWSFVHNKLRNRLSLEKSKKLINIYYTLKIKDTNVSVDY